MPVSAQAIQALVLDRSASTSSAVVGSCTGRAVAADAGFARNLVMMLLLRSGYCWRCNVVVECVVVVQAVDSATRVVQDIAGIKQFGGSIHGRRRICRDTSFAHNLAACFLRCDIKHGVDVVPRMHEVACMAAAASAGAVGLGCGHGGHNGLSGVRRLVHANHVVETSKVGDWMAGARHLRSSGSGAKVAAGIRLLLGLLLRVLHNLKCHLV